MIGNRDTAIAHSERSVHLLRGISGLTALLVAWIHILHPQYGITQLLLLLEVGTLYDPRPPLFVVSGVLLLVGIVVCYFGLFGIPRRYLYLAGIVLMGGYLSGYFLWHTVLDHGAFWPYIEGHGHSNVGLTTQIIQHLQNDSIAAVSKIAEGVTLLSLAMLWWIETAQQT